MSKFNSALILAASAAAEPESPEFFAAEAEVSVDAPEQQRELTSDDYLPIDQCEPIPANWHAQHVLYSSGDHKTVKLQCTPGWTMQDGRTRIDAAVCMKNLFTGNPAWYEKDGKACFYGCTKEVKPKTCSPPPHAVHVLMGESSGKYTCAEGYLPHWHNQATQWDLKCNPEMPIGQQWTYADNGWQFTDHSCTPIAKTCKFDTNHISYIHKEDGSWVQDTGSLKSGDGKRWIQCDSQSKNVRFPNQTHARILVECSSSTGKLQYLKNSHPTDFPAYDNDGNVHVCTKDVLNPPHIVIV
jgi:hypothetical protein